MSKVFRNVAALAIGSALMLTGCTKQNSSLAGPSMPGGMPASSLDAHNSPGTSRHYKVTMTAPTPPVTAGVSTSFSFTLTNCDTATCGAGNETQNNQQIIQSAEIVPPAGFTITPGSAVVVGGTWSATVMSNTIVLGRNAAPQNANALSPGESITVTFTATAACGADDQWDTNAYQDALVGVVLDTDTPYELVGFDPMTEVQDCAVQACSPGFFMNHPSAYTDALFESVFNTGVVSNTWMLSDALDNPGNPPSAPQPNPYNANFVGTGAYLSSVLVAGYPYSTGFVVDAVQDAHNGDPTGLNVLAAVFSSPHVCPLE